MNPTKRRRDVLRHVQRTANALTALARSDGVPDLRPSLREARAALRAFDRIPGIREVRDGWAGVVRDLERMEAAWEAGNIATAVTLAEGLTAAVQRVADATLAVGHG